jgi:hypothetical protein
MSWPWTTISLPEDSTPAEIRAAHAAWRSRREGARPDPSDPEIDRAFIVALEMAEERDPSHLDPSQYPNPWRATDEHAAPGAPQAPALRPEHPPVPSADVLATTLLGMVRQAPDFEAFTTALARVQAWRDFDTRVGADRQLRDWLTDGGELTPLQVVRLARVFDWQPTSAALQSPERDLDWRRLVKQAYDIVAPPDPAYTGSIGRSFLVVGAVAGVGLALLLLPRVMSGSLRILIPVALAALCAWALIRWRR